MQVTAFSGFAQVITGPNNIPNGIMASYSVPSIHQNRIHYFGNVQGGSFSIMQQGAESIDVTWSGTPRIITTFETPIFGAATVDFNIPVANNQPDNQIGDLELAPAVTMNFNDDLIQEAIDYVSQQTNGGTVILPAGTFYVGRLYLRQNVKIVGAGKGITILKRIPDDPNSPLLDGEPYRTTPMFSTLEQISYSEIYYAFLTGASNNNSFPIEISDLTLDGDNFNDQPWASVAEEQYYEHHSLIFLDNPKEKCPDGGPLTINNIQYYPNNCYEATGTGKLKVFIHDIELRNCTGDGVEQYENVDLRFRNCTSYGTRRGTLSITGGGGYSKDSNITASLVAPHQKALDLEVDANAPGIPIPGLDPGGFRAWIDDCQLDFSANFDFHNARLLITGTDINHQQYTENLINYDYGVISFVGPNGILIARDCSIPFNNVYNNQLNNINGAICANFYDCTFNLFKAPVPCAANGSANGFKLHDNLLGSGSKFGFNNSIFQRFNFGAGEPWYGLIFKEDYSTADAEIFISNPQNNPIPSDGLLKAYSYNNNNGCPEYVSPTYPTGFPIVIENYTELHCNESEDDMKEHFGIKKFYLLQWTAVTQTNVSCNGFSDGSITVTTQGVPNISITYDINPNVGNQVNPGNFTGLPAGTYTVTATDITSSPSYAITTLITITEPLPLKWETLGSGNVSRNGGNDGFINIGATGGTGTISYNLMAGNVNNGTGIFTNLTANTYTVTAIDANGCTLTTSITITEPPALVLTAIAGDAVCNGGNGLLTFSASGGTAPIDITINGSPQVSPFATAAGTYTIVATDDHGCTASTTLVITEPPALILTVGATNALCNGDNGLLSFSASGGTGAIAITVNGGNPNSPYATGAGSYTIIATDANGCIASTIVIITQPTALAWATPVINDVLCNGAITGSFTVSVSGGTPSYEYKLGAGAYQASGSFPNLAAGNYTITAQDGNACTISTTITITQPPAISWTNVVANNITCNNFNNGSVFLAASGGNGTLTYNLQNVGGVVNITNQTGNFTNLAAAVYTISAMDANGCFIATTAVVTNPQALSWTATNFTNITCTGNNADGTIAVTASGGTGIISYNLNPGNITNTSGSFNNLGMAIYTILATDANGCIMSTTIEFIDPLSGNFCCSQFAQNLVATPNVILKIAPTAANLVTQYGNVITGKTFYIDGIFAIDQSISFVACTLYFTPGSQVILQNPNTFDVNNSTLMAACDWWEGILANDAQQKVVIDGNSYIKNALVGVNISDNAILEASNSHFIDNGNVCIAFSNLTATNYTGFVLNNAFATISPLPAPYQKTGIGISIVDVTQINIGNLSFPNFVNSFDNLLCGIRVSESNTTGTSIVRLYNNIFDNIHAIIPPNVTLPQQYIVNNTFNDMWGSAIYANFAPTSNQMNQYGYLFVQHTNLPNNNTFQNCDRGIVSVGANTTVLQQKMQDCLLGIMCHSPFKRTYFINHNLINGTHIGIELFGRQQYSEINHNTISLNTAILSQIGPVSITPPISIRVQQGQMSQNAPPTYFINYNEISVSTITGVGIYTAYGDVQAQTKGNTISFASTSLASSQSHKLRTLIGVWADKCTEANFEDNNTVGFTNPTLYEARNSYGMYMDNSPWCRWSCNKTNYTQFGFYVWGNNETGKDNVTFNEHDANEFSWSFFNAAQAGTFGNLGDAGAGGVEPGNIYVGNNNWLGQLGFNPGPYKVFRFSTDNFPNQIYTNSALLDYSESEALDPLARYYVGLNGNAYTSPCANPLVIDPIEVTADSGLINYIFDVIADSISYTNYSDVGAWMDRYKVYCTLDIDSLLRYSDPSLSNFYDSLSLLNIGHLRDAERAINLLYDRTTNEANFAIRYAAAETANNAVSSGEDWEMYEKTINDAIILLSVMPPDSLPLILKQDIGEIALMCPFIGGNAVLKARPLWTYWQPNAIFDDRLLCMQGQNKNQDNSNIDIDSMYAAMIKERFVKIEPSTTKLDKKFPQNLANNSTDIEVYPNPASTYIVISYYSKINGSFKLINSLGERILVTELSCTNTRTQIPLLDLANGIYHYEIEFSNINKTIGKLSILK